MTIVTLPGVSRNSIGYGCPMMPGMPGGTQLAVSLSSRPSDCSSFRFAAAAGVSDGPCGAPRPRPPPPPPGPISQTPVKSGSLASVDQSVAVGPAFEAVCALVTPVAIVIGSSTAAHTRRVRGVTRIDVSKRESLPLPLRLCQVSNLCGVWPLHRSARSKTPICSTPPRQLAESVSEWPSGETTYSTRPSNSPALETTASRLRGPSQVARIM